VRPRAGLPRQRSAPACQRGESRTNRRGEALAGRGQPWALRVTTRVTVSAEVRSRENAVPWVAVTVWWHAVHRNRLS
jgi:hypothetical protein